MKSIITTIVTAIIVSVLTFVLASKYGIPGVARDYSGQVSTETNTQVIQQYVEEYTKTSYLDSDITKAIETVGPAVVSIVATKDMDYYLKDPFTAFQGIPTTAISTTKKQKVKVGGGSGIIISKDGYIITNKHVVSDLVAEYTIINSEGDMYTTEMIRRDSTMDIAILKILDKNKKIPDDLTVASFTSLKTPVKVGQFIVTIGNALTEYANSASFGIISAKNRSLVSQDASYIGLYQTDAKTHPGNSGGPAISTNGEVIGINTAKDPEDQMSFILPVTREYIQATLAGLTTSGTIIRPNFGVETHLLSKAVAKTLGMTKFDGVMIQSVAANSPASRAGLLSGDIITEINGDTVQRDLPFIYTLNTFKVGDTIKMITYRDKDYKRLEVSLSGANSQLKNDN